MSPLLVVVVVVQCVVVSLADVGQLREDIAEEMRVLRSDKEHAMSTRFNATDKNSHLFILHIPKSGGTTFSTFFYEHIHTFGGFYSKHCTMYPKLPKKHCLAKGRQDFLTIPSAHRTRVRTIEGHFPYGLHSLLLDAAGPPASHACRYITIIREPTSRFLSQWHYSKRHKLSLATYVRATALNVCNLQVGLLAGLGSDYNNSEVFYWGGQPGGFLPHSLHPANATGRDLGREVLAIAKRRIASPMFSLVMVLERMPESLCLLGEILLRGMRADGSNGTGFRELCGLSYKTINTHRSISRAVREEMDAERDAAKACNSLDDALYAHAVQLLERRLDEFPVCRTARLEGSDRQFTAAGCPAEAEGGDDGDDSEGGD